MPSAPVPAAVDEFLRRPNPAVVASLRRDGSPHTVATWYDWEDNRVLLNLDESRLRLRFMRRDPRVALTVLDEEGWHRHVSLLGRIISLDEDRELRDIDRLSLRYTGGRFRTRDRRRFSAWVVVESWHGWDGAPVAGKNVVRGSSSPVGLASRCPGAAERHPTAQPLLGSRSSADSGC